MWCTALEEAVRQNANGMQMVCAQRGRGGASGEVNERRPPGGVVLLECRDKRQVRTKKNKKNIIVMLLLLVSFINFIIRAGGDKRQVRNKKKYCIILLLLLQLFLVPLDWQVRNK